MASAALGNPMGILGFPAAVLSIPTMVLRFGPMNAATGAPADPRHAAMLQQLAARDSPQFDRAYARMQVTAHREAVGLFTACARFCADPQLAGFARQLLPDLRAHLASARRL